MAKRKGIVADREVKFGIGQLGNKTPIWAKNVFRVTMLLTTAISAWVASTGLIPEGTKLEIVLGFKLLDTTIWGVSKLFGIEGEPIDKPR